MRSLLAQPPENEAPPPQTIDSIPQAPFFKSRNKPRQSLQIFSIAGTRHGLA
jgi:hypothetical protein